jgi:hypothetical protein
MPMTITPSVFARAALGVLALFLGANAQQATRAEGAQSADTPILTGFGAKGGYDAHAGDYIGHWLDRFDAAGALVVHQGI